MCVNDVRRLVYIADQRETNMSIGYVVFVLSIPRGAWIMWTMDMESLLYCCLTQTVTHAQHHSHPFVKFHPLVHIQSYR